MKERPILFSAPMVRAILAGAKTQTRRLVGAPGDWAPIGPEAFSPTVIDRNGDEQPGPETYGAGNADGSNWIRCPYGQPGDRLWVREAWRITGDSPEDMLDMFDRDDVQYRADDDQSYIDKYRPSIHMPRWASRILLEVIAVRVERLEDISEADAIAEGIERAGECNWRDYLDDGNDFAGARYSYRSLWEQINGPGSWDANPWVWADAVAEGVDFAGHTDEIMHDYSPDERFSMLWESINGAGSWNENPWVWVVEFRRVEA